MAAVSFLTGTATIAEYLPVALLSTRVPMTVSPAEAAEVFPIGEVAGARALLHRPVAAIRQREPDERVDVSRRQRGQRPANPLPVGGSGLVGQRQQRERISKLLEIPVAQRHERPECHVAGNGDCGARSGSGLPRPL